MKQKKTLADHSPLIRELLEKRGITSEEEALKFLYPEYDSDLHDPTLFVDGEKASERIWNAINEKEKIIIYADFDCDGIPAAVILADFFRKILYDNFEVYIPHRHNEGYGFHTAAVDTLAEGGAKLIITVDVGIGGHEAVLRAKSHGVDVIITDHHEIESTLPDAVAIVHPARAPYPFSGLCGSGVAFKLVQLLIIYGKAHKHVDEKTIPIGWEKWLLDMVGIATIADMVPLSGENRVLAHYGLVVLRKSARPGIAAFCKKLRLTQRDITEDDIGFSIAPRVNAASRMDEPELAYKLLSTSDPKEAEAIATQLESLNRKRKGAVGAIVKEAKKRMDERGEKDGLVFVTGDPRWKPSLLGLVANSLLDGHGGAVCIWGKDGTGALKGSCRSDGSVQVVELFKKASETLEQYGGHACAGGFEVSHDNVHTLSSAFNDAATKTDLEEVSKKEADMELPISRVSWDLWRELAALAPFGIANPKPVFKFSNVTVEDVRLFGKENNHTEVIFGDSRSQIRAFQFFVSPDVFTNPPSPGSEAHIIATVERDTFKGREKVALRLIDVA